jgi:hypothetical protein
MTHIYFLIYQAIKRIIQCTGIQNSKLEDCNYFSWVRQERLILSICIQKIRRVQLFYMGQIRETHSKHWHSENQKIATIYMGQVREIQSKHWYSELKIRRLQLFYMGQVRETYSKHWHTAELKISRFNCSI